MKYKVLTLACMVSAGLMTSCMDDFSELNQKPSDITQPNIRYLFTQCESAFQPADYSQWYGGFRDISSWAQTTVPAGGNSSDMNRPDVEANGCGYQVNEVLRYTNEIRYQIENMSDEDKAKYEYIKYLCNPMLVYLSIEDADMFGSRQYTEAEMARYTNPPLLLPKYDTQEELVEVWLKELDETLNYLNNNPVTDLLSSQDFIYHGKVDKWAKLANSLKLRIAARLINKDRARAIKIAEEVVANPAGVLSSLDDDFVFNKGKKDNNWNNNITVGVGSQQLINFMISNRDPRLFYFFQKNDYNSNVIQGYFDQDKDLPSYIAENVEYKEENGKKLFTGWKAPGEPWVRYYGLPCEIGAGQDNQYRDYFDPAGVIFSLVNKNGDKKTYQPLAKRNLEMIKGMLTYTFPDVPDVAPEEDKEQYGWYGLYFSAGEVNLLLAEFKLLGANLPRTAQDYLTDGITLSVQGYDFVVGKNHIPYYDTPYKNDKFDKTIKLTNEQLAEMLTHDAYKLTGDKKSDLEKVYIQQYIHYLQAPIDQYVTMRRSGVPMKNSQLLPRKELDKQLGDTYYIPRRFATMAPDKSNLLYDLTIKAFQDQGYSFEGTEAINPENLNKQRVWIDKENPDFGAGPIL